MTAGIPVLRALGGCLSPDILSHSVISTSPSDEKGGEENDFKEGFSWSVPSFALLYC